MKFGVLAKRNERGDRTDGVWDAAYDHALTFAHGDSYERQEYASPFAEGAEWGAGWAFALLGMAEAIRENHWVERCQKEAMFGRTCGEARAPHTCPYGVDVHGDENTFCNCCEACEFECAQDI